MKLALIALSALLIASLLTSCTMVRYNSGDTSLLVIDIHPGGESIALDGVLTSKGKLSVNRDQGSNEGIITSTVDAVTGIPGL